MKITDSEIQKNDYASLAFAGLMKVAVQRMRESIDFYRDLDKINSSILGEIRALSLLCPHCAEATIMTQEATEWKAVLLDYFERHKQKIPKKFREQFFENLTADLDNIIAHSLSLPLWLWEDEAKKREIVVKVKNQALKDQYIALAEKKYSKLGGALENYLTECLENLLETSEKSSENNAEEIQKSPKSVCFSPTFLPLEEGKYSYLVDDFQCFLTEKQRKQDKEISAYDVEKKVKKYIKGQNKDLLKKLSFDCESSLFSVQSDDLQALNELNGVLLQLSKTK